MHHVIIAFNEDRLYHMFDPFYTYAAIPSIMFHSSILVYTMKLYLK
jgi:hypothetical protein